MQFLAYYCIGHVFADFYAPTMSMHLKQILLYYYLNSILDVVWLQDIWRPDVFFKNAKQVTFHEMSVPNHYLWLYHDKTLIYMAK